MDELKSGKCSNLAPQNPTVCELQHKLAVPFGADFYSIQCTEPYPSILARQRIFLADFNLT
jgi:hypothetical protein